MSGNDSKIFLYIAVIGIVAGVYFIFGGSHIFDSKNELKTVTGVSDLYPDPIIEKNGDYLNISGYLMGVIKTGDQKDAIFFFEGPREYAIKTINGASFPHLLFTLHNYSLRKLRLDDNATVYVVESVTIPILNNGYKDLDAELEVQKINDSIIVKGKAEYIDREGTGIGFARGLYIPTEDAWKYTSEIGKLKNYKFVCNQDKLNETYSYQPDQGSNSSAYFLSLSEKEDCKIIE
jgi:hypothetical protein